MRASSAVRSNASTSHVATGRCPQSHASRRRQPPVRRRLAAGSWPPVLIPNVATTHCATCTCPLRHAHVKTQLLSRIDSAVILNVFTSHLTSCRRPVPPVPYVAPHRAALPHAVLSYPVRPSLKTNHCTFSRSPASHSAPSFLIAGLRGKSRHRRGAASMTPSQRGQRCAAARG